MAMLSLDNPRRIGRWTPELDAKLREAWERLKDQDAVADELGISAEAVRHRRQKLGMLVGRHNNGGKSTWTEEMDAILISMRGKNSAAVIGERLGVSRFAVLGRVWRLGLEKLKKVYPPVTKRRPKKAGGGGRIRTHPLLVIDNTVTVEDTDIPIEQRCSIGDLSDATCRWPVGDPQSSEFFFCGATPASGYPYCNKHALRAYLIPGAA